MPATFLDLPGELRNIIYDLYLAAHKHVDLLIVHPHSPTEGTYLHPPLSRVSHQIRQEFLSIWGPVNTSHAWTLKAFVHNLDLEPLLTFLVSWDNQFRHYRFTDVRFVFRFTDAAHIAEQQGEKNVAWLWQRLKFKHMTGRLRPFKSWMIRYGPRVQVFPPVTSHKAIIDWQSLGGEGARSRTVSFSPSPKLFGDIVKRAEEALKGQRPADAKRQERVFRTWLKLELDREEHRPRGRRWTWR